MGDGGAARGGPQLDDRGLGRSPSKGGSCVLQSNPFGGEQVRSRVGRSAGDTPSRSGRFDIHCRRNADGAAFTPRRPREVSRLRSSSCRPLLSVAIRPRRCGLVAVAGAYRPPARPSHACAAAGRNGLRGAAVTSLLRARSRARSRVASLRLSHCGTNASLPGLGHTCTGTEAS
jgi:hypothetical protein